VVSGLFTGTFGTGASGDLTIDAPRLTIRNGAAVSAETRGEGQGGQLTVVDSDSVELIGTTSNLQSGSALSTATAGAGAAGNLTINTGQLTVRDGAAISTATLGEGRAGTLTINASESVQVSGTDAAGLFNSGLTTQTVGAGAAGDLTINTRQLTISDRAKILAATTGGESGSIIVTANTFEATNGGQLRTTTQSSNDAGDITLNVLDSVTLAGEDSGLFANTEPDSTGNGGSILISNPETVLVRDGAQIAVDSQGAGTGGNIEIRAASLTLDNRASLSAETASNIGGDITLSLDDWLLMRRGSRLSTTAGTAQQGGDGGNIAIEADLVVAVPDENSDITANAFSGQGGRVTITTQGLYNFVIRSREEIQALLGTDDLSQFDPSQLPTNDITAISQTSPTLSQIPTLNLQGIDPSQGLVELSTELVDVSRLVEQNLCAASQGSEFTITGRGGLPAPPG
jgi:large exoprotein involved in heme utilization and adhesion